MIGLPVMQLRGSMGVIYNERIDNGVCKLFRQDNLRKNRKIRYNGKMSPGARKRLNKAISLLVLSVKPIWMVNPVTNKMFLHKLSFLTLDIPGSVNITARDAYENVMKYFLQWLRRTKHVKMYIWKAELQKRGQIHYHIVFREFIHHKDIREKWNSLLREAGLLAEYFAEKSHYNAPTTSINAVQHVQKLDRYIAKELAKSFTAMDLQAKKEADDMLQRGEISFDDYEKQVEAINENAMRTVGKIWDCSECLSAAKLFNFLVGNKTDKLIERFAAEKKVKLIKEDFFTVVLFEDISPHDLLQPDEKKLFRAHLDAIPLYERKKKVKEVQEDYDYSKWRLSIAADGELKKEIVLQQNLNF